MQWYLPQVILKLMLMTCALFQLWLNIQRHIFIFNFLEFICNFIMAQNQLSVYADLDLLKGENDKILTPMKSFHSNIERNKKGCEGYQKKNDETQSKSISTGLC